MFTNGSLVISSVVSSDQGRYTCTATNRRGLSSASTANIRVIGRSASSTASCQPDTGGNFIFHHFQFLQNSKIQVIPKKPSKLIKDFPCFVPSLLGTNPLAFTGKKMGIS